MTKSLFSLIKTDEAERDNHWNDRIWVERMNTMNDFCVTTEWKKYIFWYIPLLMITLIFIEYVFI
jgi:hypothetical protein